MPDCAACSRPVTDALLCRGCIDELKGELRALIGSAPTTRFPERATEQRAISSNRGLIAELGDTLTRQARVGQRNGRRGPETPLPFHLAASIDLETLRDALAMWAQAVAAQRGVTVDADHTPTAYAAWLLRWAGEVAQHEAADELLGDILAMTKAARRTIDLAPELRYVGPCDGHRAIVDDTIGCGKDLYASLNAHTVTCGTEGCDAEYNIETRRIWLLEQAVDQLRTTTQLSRELPWIAGITINAKLIGMWAARGKLTRYLPHPHDTRAATRYRVGEVIELAREMASDQAAVLAHGGANGAA